MKISIEKINNNDLKSGNLLFSIFKSIFTPKGNVDVKQDDGLKSLEVLLDNHNPLKLNIEYDNLGIEGDKIKDSFTDSVLGYTDIYELGIFKIKTQNIECEINENYFTGFCIELNGKLILQRIFRDKESNISSELIAFNPNNGEIDKYGEIGNYEIYEYEPEKESLTGGNQKEHITVRFEKPIANTIYSKLGD